MSLPPTLRVAFIEPGNFPLGFGHTSVYKGVLMPRAGTSLAAVLQQQGHQVTVISGELTEINVHQIAAAHDVICISVMSNSAPYGYVLAHQFGELGLPTIMGGYHFAHNETTPAALQPTEEALLFCDWVIRGEGYISLPLLLQILTSNRLDQQELQQVNGLSWRQLDGHFHHNPLTKGTAALDTLPPADWTTLQDRHLLRVVGAHGMVGCPRDCSWCAVRSRDGVGKNRNTPEGLVAEVRAALQVLPRALHLFFSSDNFVVVRDWAHGICQEMQQQEVHIPWTCQVEVPTLVDHPALAEELALAGCVRACVGFESINDRALHDSDKRQRVADMEEVVRTLHRAGIAIHGMFIVGLPGDDLSAVERTLDWACKMQIETIQLLCLSDLPGSRDYEEQSLWQHSYRPFKGAYAPLNWAFLTGHYARLGSDALTLKQVQHLSVGGMRHFYNWWRIARAAVWPRPEIWRAKRRHGAGFWRATAQTVWHMWVACGLRYRGWANIREWLGSPLNQAYLRSLRAHTEAARELAIDQMLDEFPPEWLDVFEAVAAREEALRDSTHPGREVPIIILPANS